MAENNRPRSVSSSQSKLLSTLLISTSFALLSLSTAGCLVDQPRKVESPTTAQVALPHPKVAVVGTIHKMHLVDRGYPMQVLDALIEEWNPDLVLVAIPPEALAAGAWEQSPIEFPYVVWSARHARIPVEGIGWHNPAGCKAKAAGMQAKIRTVTAKMKKAKASGKPLDIKTMMAEKMASMLPKDVVGPARSIVQLMPPSFETAHSVAFERLQRVLFNAMARTKPKMFLQAVAQEANMAHLAAQAIRKHHASRVLVVVGLRHRLALADYLAGLGAQLVAPDTIIASRGLEARAFLNRPISQQVIAMWRTAVDHIKAKLAQATGPMRFMLAMKKHCFEVAMAQNGRCCVSPDKLFVSVTEISTSSPAGSSTARPAPARPLQPPSAAAARNAGDAGTGGSDSNNEPKSSAEGTKAQPQAPSSTPRPASRPRPPAGSDDAQGDSPASGQSPSNN